jgi:hypothetical protein
MKTRIQIENLLAHYRNGESDAHHAHNPACREESVAILEWVLRAPEATPHEDADAAKEGEA